MSRGYALLAWMVFLVLCPVLDIGGHFIYLPEFCIYLWFLGRVLISAQQLDEPADVSVFRRRVFNAHVSYAVLFVVTVLLTAWLAQQSINNYDTFMLRNIVQLIFCLKLFGEQLRRIESEEQLQRTLFRLIVLLSVPALIVYLQALDLFSFRSIVLNLYKPQFFFLGEMEFSAYRYTSVFKDFFTAAVYFTLLAAFIFHFFLRTTLGFAHRAALILLLVAGYGAQLFVARTSLILTPVVLAAIAVFAAPRGVGAIFGRLLPAAAFTGLLAVAGVAYLLNSGLVNASWAGEGLAVFTSGDLEQSSSLSVMNQWHEQMFSHAFKGEYSLLSPSHGYFLTEVNNPGVYTDSFYGQELYRFGIYGAIAYLVYLALMLRATLPTSRMAAILVIALAVMNYKGGNTFFMPKTIYLYALTLAAVPWIEYRRAE